MTNYKELVKQRTSIPGYIEEVERFETWWNKNLATVVAYYDGYYRVFLLVYDPVYSSWSPAVFPTDKDCNYWGGKSRGKHNSSLDARSEANWLRGELVYSWNKGYNNPILVIHPYSDCSRSFSEFITSPYVVKDCIYHPILSSLSKGFKPLDIAWVLCGVYFHVGFYVDEDKIFHFSGENNKVEITNSIDFMKSLITTGMVTRYHPVIPFKNYRDVIRQAVWAKDNDFRKGSYNLANWNCEHFANICVYGVNFSQQVSERNRVAVGLVEFFRNPELFSEVNNNKTSVCLKSEIKETNDMLGKKSDYETEKYETKYLQEVPPKENCRIM